MSMFCRLKKNVLWSLISGLSMAWLGGGAIAYGAGTPVAWGVESMTNVPAALSNRVVAIASGMEHAIALLDDGTVVGWGVGSSSYTPPANLTGVKAIAAGGFHCLALLSNGTVRAWGDQDQSTVPNLTGVQQIAAGDYHNLALLSNGWVVQWDSYGNVTYPVQGATAIAAGASHSLARLSDGRVVAWGQNGQGQASVPTGLTGVTAVAAGVDFSLALRAGGAVTAWGNSANGRTTPPFSTGATALTAGADAAHALAIRNGAVVAWGNNSAGQTIVPQTVSTSKVIAICAGATHSVALILELPRIVTQPLAQAAVEGDRVTFSVSAIGGAPLTYQWRQGSANIPNATNATYTIYSASTNLAGAYTVVVANDAGSITSSIANLTIYLPASIVGQPQNLDIAEGGKAIFSVTARGTAVEYQWRKNGTNLPMTANPYNSSLVINNAKLTDTGGYSVLVSNLWGSQLSASAALVVHALPVIITQPKSDTVVAGSPVTFTVEAANATDYQWQKGGVNIATAINTTYGINSVQISDGGDYNVVVSNAYGKVTSATATLTVTAAPALTTNIILWGEQFVAIGGHYADMSPPGGLDDTVAISAGAYHHLVLKRDGSVDGWGDNSYGQAKPVNPVTGATAVAAGGFHSLALLGNGNVVAWGLNTSGQTDIPAGLAGVKAIAAGAFHSLALKNNGQIAAWGSSEQNQTLLPPSVIGGSVQAIAAGSHHSLALLSNSTVVAWGANDYSQCRVPLGLTNVIAIAAGDNHSLALKQDGTVAAWGNADAGTPPNLQKVVAIAAGANHSIALQPNGTVVCWGVDNYYQTNAPAGLNGVFAIAAGGNRSLAVRRPPLRLATPRLMVNGLLQILLGNADDTPINSNRVSRLSVYGATNFSLPLTNWNKLAASTLRATNNLLIFYDGFSTNTAKRFYRASETP